MRKNTFKFLFILTMFGILSFSCDDTKLEEPQFSLKTTQDNILSERAANESLTMVIGLSGTQAAKAVVSCPSYNWSNNLLTIDFGVEGCITNGIAKTGIIYAQFSENFIGNWAVNNFVTITFSDFTIDGNALTGTIVATCTDIDPKVFHVTSTDMALTFNDNNSIGWETVADYTILSGGSTYYWTDDEWQIDGTNQGIDRLGNAFSRQAVALTTSVDCEVFISGNLIITIRENEIYDIEFGPACGTIFVTFNGMKIPITLQ